MSKRSQEEARERKEQASAERERRFSLTLAEWIQTFVEYYKENPPSDSAMMAYKVTLERLSPDELSIGCKEALKFCDHIPRAKEILQGLRVARERMNAYGHSAAERYPENDPPSEEVVAEFNKGMEALKRKIAPIAKAIKLSPFEKAQLREPGE